MKTKQPWIGKPWIDVVFILLPPFLSLSLIICFPAEFLHQEGLSDAWWVILILLVDVAHVYSTLYRTYFDERAFEKHKTKLVLVPLLAFVTLVLLYSLSVFLFWRVLAYIAVFHFVRQQYGFMRIYSRTEKYSKLYRRIDTLTIYASTIYPIIYWHLSGDRNFKWFVPGDFYTIAAGKQLIQIATATYVLLLVTYSIKEITVIVKTGFINLPKNAIIAGTAISWYFGIVYFNGDMVFTLLNVVSHGVPYMALIWLYGSQSVNKGNGDANRLIRRIYSRFGILLFLGIIFLLAFVEEGLWDIAVWKEHTRIFNLFHWKEFQLNNKLLSLVVPLLALPQITHYIVDGFIWKMKKEESNFSDKVNELTIPQVKTTIAE